ncbi:hypothetical protein EOI86_05835 [Hwanghaeella grinnelliae]|uniref:DUF2147 domain-containing protein n=1 Tax=Hwanghaeella grinnelliae TaxID=2500179 RepID=A0A437QW92_9PROT|nr:hypothetical protein [Hwanghaeella grinnelliae]RVU38788.1 hypothetical protein EOI86_05835 [Hwanghaeella grinnelliae]
MPSFLSSMKQVALTAVLLTGLAGCNTAGLLPGEPSPYDGIWAGRVLFTYGVASCPRRGAIKAEIRGGNLDAELRWSDGTGDMDGSVREDGTLFGSSMSRKGFDFGEAEGKFEERTAKGTFSGKKCRGSWELQKVRNL